MYQDRLGRSHPIYKRIPVDVEGVYSEFVSDSEYFRMEAVDYSETLVLAYQTIWHHIPENP